MFSLSENYYLRKCYLQRDEVPTQTMMREKMSPALADVYFKSMSPNLKKIAGLEPKLKGGGNNWYQPPDELLKGRAVLKPIRKQVLVKLNYLGIDDIGTPIFQKHRKEMDSKIEQALLDSDINWRSNVKATCDRLWSDLVAAATKKNTDKIMHDFNKFVYYYRQSLGKIEILFHESAIAEIKKSKENSLHEMQIKYATVLKHQATVIYDEYEKKLVDEKTRLKDEFKQNIQNNQSAIAEKIHDLKVNKHMALDKIKQCLHCQKLACQIYVALKEREDCLKETEGLKYTHTQRVKMMKNTILVQDLEINREGDKEKKKQIFRNIWRKKLCKFVKAFQMFVLQCLEQFPEQAEFFINMEELLLLQVDAALEDSYAPSIIELEREEFHTPIPRPKPFYLFCDEGYKPKLKEDLCPKPSGISSASEIPVMIVNKRCLYVACDNFEQFTNKIKAFIHGNRGDDADFKDDLVYEHFVPVQNTTSQQMIEMKLESSLLQVLQQGLADIQTDEKEFPISKCNICELPWCSCRPCPSRVNSGDKNKLASSPMPSSITSSSMLSPITSSSTPSSITSSITSSKASRHKLQRIYRNNKLDHEREPKWDSYCWHVDPKKCSCAKTIKKKIADHLPAYMRSMKYGTPEVPGYEMCSFEELKTLVEKARKLIRQIPIPLPIAVPSKSKDKSTQCYEPRFEAMCICSSNEFSRFINDMKRTAGSINKFENMSPSFMTQKVDSFATFRAHSLKNLVENLSELGSIFKKDSCNFK